MHAFGIDDSDFTCTTFKYKTSSNAMATTIQSVPSPPGHSSPKSVMLHATETIVEQFALTNGELRSAHSHKIRLDSLKEPTAIVCEDNRDRWIGVKRPRYSEPWICPASKKSKLTTNPVQAIVAQVADRIRQGCQRPDGKNPLSLAVSASISSIHSKQQSDDNADFYPFHFSLVLFTV